MTWQDGTRYLAKLLWLTDLDEIKRDVKTIYDNQIEQAEVLSDIVSIANVSRALINENRIARA